MTEVQVHHVFVDKTTQPVWQIHTEACRSCRHAPTGWYRVYFFCQINPYWLKCTELIIVIYIHFISKWYRLSVCDPFKDHVESNDSWSRCRVGSNVTSQSLWRHSLKKCRMFRILWYSVCSSVCYFDSAGLQDSLCKFSARSTTVIITLQVSSARLHIQFSWLRWYIQFASLSSRLTLHCCLKIHSRVVLNKPEPTS